MESEKAIAKNLAEKFYFIQVNDFCDIFAVLFLVLIFSSNGKNMFTELPPSQMKLFWISSAFEAGLEVFTGLLLPYLICRFTRYKNFNPIARGLEVIQKHQLVYSIAVANLFPFALFIMNDV